MPKLIPSREELEDFITLLKRYASASRAPSGCGADGELTYDYYKSMSMLREKLSTRLATLDFRVTYGWPDSLRQALEPLRSGGPSSGPSKSQSIKQIKVFILVRVFNLNPPKSAMVNLDRVIEDLEAAMSIKPAESADEKPRWDRESKTLSFSGVQRKYRQARNQFKILDAFETSRWEGTIANPLRDASILAQTVKDMNRGLKGRGLIYLWLDSPRVGWKPEKGDLP